MPDDKPVNGTPPTAMSAAERLLWLASHAAPAGMLLVEGGEFERITSVLIQQQRLLKPCLIERNKMRLILGTYEETEPDLLNAVASAVFDAERYKKGSDLATGGLKKAKENLDALIASESAPVNFAFRSDLLDVSKAIGDEISTLERQAALRRNRGDLRK